MKFAPEYVTYVLNENFEDAKALFEPFHRAKRAPDGGHGLGLSIVRSITLAHHGQTRVDYTENGQFAITVTLPRRQPT